MEIWKVTQLYINENEMENYIEIKLKHLILPDEIRKDQISELTLQKI